MSKKACYIFSSSPSQGALNIRDEGSRFSVQMTSKTTILKLPVTMMSLQICRNILT